MKQIEKLAIKYLILGLGIGLLKFFLLFLPRYYLNLETTIQLAPYREIISYIIAYIPNIIFGVFLLIDSIKFAKNKIMIPILGFCMPVFGICFLIIEKYIILKLNNNG